MRRPGTVTFGFAVPALAVIALVGATVACGLGDGRVTSPVDVDEAVAACTPGDCTVVDLAVSPDKAGLITELAKTFNAGETVVDGRRVVVRPREKASATARRLLAGGWPDDAGDPPPVIWSPATRAWGDLLDEERAAAGQPPMAGRPTSVLRSPLVLAMPRRMAEALGHPSRPVGWHDLRALADDPRGWAAHGRPEWGPFRLGKTDPRSSTTGLLAVLAQYHAAARPPGQPDQPDATRTLATADIESPEAAAFNRSIESAVIHYGDSALAFLANWSRADQRGNPYRYASAVVVEEKSVVDYNRGDPDGVAEAEEVPRPPRDPLVAVYPADGAAVADHPFYVLDAEWVSPTERAAAEAFVAFALRRDSQELIARSGHRPADPSVPPGPPLTPDHGVDPAQPATTAEPPDGAVLRRMLDTWSAQRKGARVLLVVDVSGSMADEAAPGQSKLALAKAAVQEALARFRDDDLVGLRQFSTGLGPARDQLQIDLVPVGTVADQRAALQDQAEALAPANGTPLYAVTRSALRDMVTTYDPGRINAVVLLTDGQNEDGDTADDARQRGDLIRDLQSQTQGESGRPVRLFTIGYGGNADAAVLKEMAEATNGRYYGATADPTTIGDVFAQVMSNF